MLARTTLPGSRVRPAGHNGAVKSSRDDLLDTPLILAGSALHVAACYRLDYVPPNRGFEVLVVGLPLAVGAVAALAVLIRSERRPLQAACLLEWLLVLYALPANFVGLAFVPSAAALRVGLFRGPTAIGGGRAEAR